MRADSFKATSFLFATAAVLAAALVTAECDGQVVGDTQGESSDRSNFVGRVSASHRFGDGPGFSDGYTTVEWLMPTYDDWDDRMLFFDGRAIFSDTESRLGSNIGLVYREFDAGLNRIFGGMAYWDTRYTDHFVFQQVTFGVETLGQYIDARAFLHLPTHDEHTNENQFQGNLFVLGGRTIALAGGTAEVGVNLPRMGDFQASGFAGIYRFEDAESPTADGWSARAEVWWRDTVGVDVTVQDDDVFGRTTSISVTLNQLVDMRAYGARRSMDHMFRPRCNQGVVSRLGERVRRLENIVVNEVRPPQAAANLGIPYNFLHVVDGAAAGGNGGISSPFDSITAALADPAAGNSIIYTPSGGDFVENVTMVDGAKLWSNGPLQTIDTQLGPVNVPFSGTISGLTGLPTITGDVQLASNNMVSGFDITGDVTGVGITDTMFMDSRVTSAAGDAISISGGSDNVALSNLELDAGLAGLRVDDSSVTVADTTISSAGEDGVEVTVAASDRTFAATNLTITGATAEGVDLNVTGPGSLAATFGGTNLINATANAFDLTQGPGSTGDATLNLNGTTLTSTSGTGINLDGSSAGTGTLFIQTFEGNNVTSVDVGGAPVNTGGVTMSAVTFDADPLTPLIDQVTVNALTIGNISTTTSINGDGFRLLDPTGDLNIETLTIGNDNGTGLLVDTKGGGTTFNLVTGPDSVINTTNGAAMNLDPLTVDLAFASLRSSNSTTNGITLDTVDGSIVSQSTTINGSTLAAVFVDNTPAPFVVNLGNANITMGDVDVTGDNGGFLTFSTNTFNFVD